jgi:hypothetical protein
MASKPPTEHRPHKPDFNDRVAELVTAGTSNMYFFWVALLFVIVLRILYPFKPQDALLNVENDLQLLLLATSAVVQGKQSRTMEKMLEHIRRSSDRLEREQSVPRPPSPE